MILGPTSVAEPIRQALAGPTYGRIDAPFVKFYKEWLAGLKTIFQTMSWRLAGPGPYPWKWASSIRAKMEEYGIVVAGGVGPLKGKIFRVGHMANICINELALTLCARERSLTALEISVPPGATVGAVCTEWEKG